MSEATEQAPTATEVKSIRETLEHYIEGLRTGDVDLLQKAFHPEAIMTGYLGPDPMVIPIQGLYDLVSDNEAPADGDAPFAAAIQSVDVTGSTATAVVTEQGYLGHDFQDSFQLLKLDGRWQIMAKLFTTV